MESSPLKCRRNWMRRRIADRRISQRSGGTTAITPRSERAARWPSVLRDRTSGGSQPLTAGAHRAVARQGSTRPGGTFHGRCKDFLYQGTPREILTGDRPRTHQALRCWRSTRRDDERNPPELGIMERELKRIKNAVISDRRARTTRGTALPAGRSCGSSSCRNFCRRRRDGFAIDRASRISPTRHEARLVASWREPLRHAAGCVSAAHQRGRTRPSATCTPSADRPRNCSRRRTDRTCSGGGSRVKGGSAG